MGHVSRLIVFSLLLPFISLSWAQNSSSLTASSALSSTSSISSLNSTLSPSPTSSAQFPTLSGYSQCVTNCLAVGIARVNCSSITDVNCFCVNPDFPGEVAACIESDCSYQDLMTEEKLDQQFCNLASSSPTLSFPSVVPWTNTSSSSSSSSISTAVSSSSQSTPSATSKPSSGTSLKSGTEFFGGFLFTLVYTSCVFLM